MVFPIRPDLRRYRGSKESLQRRTYEFNIKAEKIADHINALVANNPEKIQQYLFENIARDLHVTADEVRAALPCGGYNGVIFGITETDRQALASYKR
jgi:hypothetical protein